MGAITRTQSYNAKISQISQIPNPPLLLHCENIDALGLHRDRWNKKTDRIGVTTAEKLGTIFAERGYTVVSGLAEGIDTTAHRGALHTNATTVATTVAVLAH